MLASAFHQFRETVFAAQTGKFRTARRIKSFVERHALFQKIECFARLSKMLFRGGQKIKRRAAIDEIGKKFFDDCNLCADFGSVVGLRRSATLLLLFLASLPWNF